MRRPLYFGARPITQTLGDKAREFFRFLSPLGEYQLFVDVWEDQGAIDWSLLDVQMAAIRINHILGGTHKDTRFDEYWSQCPFLKVPYLVYNPWTTGQVNFDWLVSNCPPTGAVLLDVEVVKDGYSPATYAQEFETFYNLCKNHGWNVAIYTAEWFLPYLSYWPVADYWWAQWPYQFYPDSTQNWAWSRIHTEMESRGSIYPSNQSQIPGRLKFWQITGDRLIFPGNSRVMDVNVAYGSLADLATWIGSEITEPSADIVEYYSFDRIKVTHGHRDTPRPYNFHLVEFSHDDIDFIEVTGSGFLRTGTSYFESRKVKFGRPPDIIKQGDEAISGVVKGLGVSMGTIYKNISSETNVQWDKNNHIVGISNKVLPNCYNATGGSNWLVDNGQVHWSVLDEPPEPDPRSGIGWNEILLKFAIIDGRNDGTLGLSKAEYAQFFIDNNCGNAHNSDGGDSNLVGVNVDGKLKILNRLVEGEEKQLPQYIGIWLKEKDMPVVPAPDGKTYQYTVTKNIALRSETIAEGDHIPPSMYSASIGTVVLGTYQTDRPTFLNEGVTWVHHLEGGVVGAIPMEWNNITYVKNFIEVTPPPPALDPINVLVQIFDDNGNEIYEPQTVVMQPKVQL